MNGSSSSPRLLIALTLGALCVGLPAGALVEDPTPTAVSRETPTQASPSPTKKPIVITDENLQDYAGRGTLTTAEPGESSSSGTGGRAVHSGGSGLDSALPPVQAPTDDSEAEKKRYWREVYQRQVEIIRQLRTQIDELDVAIPGLWNKFYAWDDPVYRDSVIKPELDQSLARREHAEKQLEEERARLPKIMDEARRDGASPGWFRDLPRPAEVLSETSTESK